MHSAEIHKITLKSSESIKILIKLIRNIIHALNSSTYGCLIAIKAFYLYCVFGASRAFWRSWCRPWRSPQRNAKVANDLTKREKNTLTRVTRKRDGRYADADAQRKNSETDADSFNSCFVNAINKVYRSMQETGIMIWSCPSYLASQHTLFNNETWYIVLV